jgi:2-polyprenyl-6-hydroxyphenyl methylase/3-demethylubiquinone-9 3-methyltransferase
VAVSVGEKEGTGVGVSVVWTYGATKEARGRAKHVSTRATGHAARVTSDGRDFAGHGPCAYTPRLVTMSAPEEETRYGFGANWRSFVATALNDARVANAVESVQRFLSLDTLRGRTFLDIGCGSGLFSLAAHLLEAERVVSFDYDPDSVAACRTLRERQGADESRWRVIQGSVLDPVFMASVEPADVVYSWGVLHHTGHMWKAVEAAGGRVAPSGLFAISIYNKVGRIPDRSSMWWKIKRFYNRAPSPVQRLMELGYASNHVATRLVTLRNPFTSMADATGEGRRGMEFWHDARDWLGGFPYEYASPGEVFRFVRDTLGFELLDLETREGNACNDFLFRRAAGSGGTRPT